MAQIPSAFLAQAIPAGAAAGDLGGAYPNPTVTGTHLSAALPVAQGGTGSATQNFVDLSTTQAAIGGAKTLTALLALGAGSTTAGSAPVLAPSFANGTAAQLTDTTRDYMVYLQISAAGTNFTLAIGPTAGVANGLVAAATLAHEMLVIRLPAGWFLQWAGTGTTLSTQIAIGC